MTWAMVVPRKGTEYPWVAKRAAKFIYQLGHNRVALRCDKDQRLRRWEGKLHKLDKREARLTVPERPPVGESQSNGIILRAVGLVASQARTLKASLEHRIGTRVPPDARVPCWLVAPAAYMMNRCDIGSDAKTLHRLHGRKAGGGCRRAKAGDLDTRSERQGIPESEDADRTLGMRAVPSSPEGCCNAFDIQVGMERPAEMVPLPPGEHPSSSRSDSRTRITTKREPREVRDVQTSVTD